MKAQNEVLDRKLILRSFEITDDPKRCTVHLINTGVSVEGDVVTVEFASNGPVQKFSCNLDREDYYDCMLIQVLFMYYIESSAVFMVQCKAFYKEC